MNGSKQKNVKLLEPVQRVTKELSAKEASISQVIPFLETLQIELSTPRESDSGIKTTKEEMLKSLKSWFAYVYNDDNFVIATLLDPRFKDTFFEEAKTKSATQVLLTICESATHQGSQESTRSTDECNEQQSELQPIDIDDSTISTDHDNSTSNSEERKGFSIWDSCQNAMKKLGKTPTAIPHNSVEKISKMISVYLDEPLMEGPKHKFIEPLEYWKNHKQQYSALATVARRYLSSPPISFASESLFSETGVIDSNRRRRLLADKIEMLTFIKRNVLL